jgi:DNA (cytosine-5)-methyltransferase 1
VTLRFVDLFAGIGGFHAAINAEFEDSQCVLASDIDAACRSVYVENFNVDVAGDIRAITDGDRIDIQQRVGPHDLLTAGFPCQPFSKSGNQRGIDEARGTLFFDICRILDARKPRFILLENVPNLVGQRHGETWSTIIRLLRSLGYAVSDEPTTISPHLIPAAEGGRPQVRTRIYIPGVYVGEERAQDSRSVPPIIEPKPYEDWNPANWRAVDYLDRADDNTARPLSDENRRAIDVWNDLIGTIPGHLPGYPIWADTFDGTLSRDGRHPAWKNFLIARSLEFYRANMRAIEKWLQRHDNLESLLPSRRKLEWQAGHDSVRDMWRHSIQLRPSGIRVKSLTYLPALVAISQPPIIGPLHRHLSPREAARLQGFSDDFVLHPKASVAYRQLGNAVSVGATRLILRRLIGDADVPPEWRALKAGSDTSIDAAAPVEKHLQGTLEMPATV